MLTILVIHWLWKCTKCSRTFK